MDAPADLGADRYKAQVARSSQQDFVWRCETSNKARTPHDGASMAALILFLASLALIAGLASAAEVAVFALSNQTVEELAARGGLRARRLATLRARPLRLLTTVWAVRIGATAGSAMVAWEIARRAFGASLTVALAAAVLRHRSSSPPA